MTITAPQSEGLRATEASSKTTLRKCATPDSTRFAASPNRALSRSLRVIGNELSLEHDHDAAACCEHGEWGEGLLRDYQAYLDRLSSPPEESRPDLLSVAVELLAFNDRVVSEVRDEVLVPLSTTPKRRSRSGVRRDFLSYHRKLRSCARRLEEAWQQLGSRTDQLAEYLWDLERSSSWRDEVVTPPRERFEACLAEFETELERQDLRELCRVSRRVRYVAERLENCAANDDRLLEHGAELFRKSLVLDGDKSKDAGLLEKYRRNIGKRLAILEGMRLEDRGLEGERSE